MLMKPPSLVSYTSYQGAPPSSQFSPRGSIHIGKPVLGRATVRGKMDA